MQKTKLLLSALTKFLLGLVLVGAILFLPAGSFSFVGGWLFIALLFIPISLLVIGFLLDYVRKHDFCAFGYYRIALGAVVLAAFYGGIIG